MNRSDCLLICLFAERIYEYKFNYLSISLIIYKVLSWNLIFLSFEVIEHFFSTHERKQLICKTALFKNNCPANQLLRNCIDVNLFSSTGANAIQDSSYR